MLTQQTTAIKPAASLLDRYRSVRAATMSFCAPLTPEDMMVQSCAEASPVKWHLAHTSWFFETFVLAEFVANYQPFHPDFRWLFNSYYKALGEMPEKKLRASFSRPPLEQILAYRQHVDDRLCRLLLQTPEDEALRRIVLGLEHEQQHLELAATDIKHAFFTNPLHPAYAPSSARARDSIAPPLEWVSFTPPSPGLVSIGVTPDPKAIDSFAFDNETPRHPVYLAPFRLASRPVACAEYLAFIEEDGYARPELWLSEGWDTAHAERLAGAALLASRPRRQIRTGASSPSTAGSPSARSPRPPSATSASLRLTPSPAGPAIACPPSSSGSSSPRSIHSPATSSNPTTFTRRSAAPPRALRSNSSATYGSGPPRPTPAIPATSRCPARSASTTASS